MDEVQFIRAIRPDAPLPRDAELAQASTRLYNAFSDAATVSPRRPQRLLWTGGAVVGVAAAVAAVVVLTANTATAPASGTGPRAAATSQAPSHVVDAAYVLHQAATAALARPNVIPRPDQFVYSRFEGDGELWLSVDGTRDGLRKFANGSTLPLPGCVNGKQTVPTSGRTGGQYDTAQSCTPQPAYDPNLPTDPTALLKYLNHGRPFDANNPSDINYLGKQVVDLLSQSYVPSSVQAALFDAIAKLPGLTVVPDATKDTGHAGIGVRWSFAKGGNEMVFDSKTYAFVGLWSLGMHGERGGGTVRVSIVDRAGQTS